MRLSLQNMSKYVMVINIWHGWQICLWGVRKMNDKENKDTKEVLLNVQSWAAVVTIIVGVITIYQFFSKNKPFPILISIVMIVLIIIFLICNIFLLKQDSRLKENINNLRHELAGKDNQLNALNKSLETCENELEKQTHILAEKNREFGALNERMEVCKDALREQDYISVGYYLIYKDIYDNFRTKLRILECDLDVEILEMDENAQKGSLQFIWRLEVINPDQKPASTVNFIYSGDKNEKIVPKVEVEARNLKQKVHPLFKHREVPGDDRFIEINLNFEIPSGQKAIIKIEYTFTKFEVFEKFDGIWLVPVALGFSGMDSFRIRFYSNKDNDYVVTNPVFRSFSLKEKFDWDDEKPCLYKELDGNRYRYETERKEVELLQERGYKLILQPEKEK